MTDLTSSEIREKLKMVEADLIDMRGGGTNIKQIVSIEAYKEYLEEELKQAEKNESKS